MNASPERNVNGERFALNAKVERRTTAGLIATLLALQLYLIFFKSFNWDEFLHYSQVYAARHSTLSAPFQVLHSRILFWVPDAADSLVTQLMLARLFMWGCTLVTMAAIFGLARQFVAQTNALYAPLAYLTAGYVFTHSFSIRADPMAAATLMGALYLFASGKFNIGRCLVVGALAGLAGMITLKSIFYAPCFAGIAWWRLCQGNASNRILVNLAVMVMAAIGVFACIYLLHKSGLAEIPARFASAGSLLRTGGGWFFADDKFPLYYLGKQALIGIIFMIAIVLAPFGWRRDEIGPAGRIALIGLAAPLFVLLVYRNTFPYFYVFLLAPVAVTVAPALGLLRERYGAVPLLVALALAPAFLTVSEPRDYIGRQAAMIDYIHREYPKPVGYLARSGSISDFPRVFDYLTTGNGIGGYYQRGEPIVAEKIEAGEMAFVLATHINILAALEGKPRPQTFLPQDVALLSDNYVQQWGPLYREGKSLPTGAAHYDFTTPHQGPYTLDGTERLVIDGIAINPGQTIVLDKGAHRVESPRRDRSILWQGKNLPSPPPMEWTGAFYTDF